MKYLSVPLALVVLSLGGLGVIAQTQTPPPQVRDVAKPVPPPTGKGRISGTVKDQAGEPVRRASVKISGDMRLDRMTMTDEQGRFALSDLPSGRFSVTANKAGYPQMSFGAKRPFRPGAGIFLQEGEHAADIALVLARGAVLTGMVYDEDGAPMPGVPVMAWEVRTSLGGERTLDYAGSEPITIISDDQGAYRVFGLPPGTYTVGTSWYYSGDRFEVRTPTEAELRAAFTGSAPSPRPIVAPPPNPPALEPTRYNYAPVFSPGVLDPLAADTFTLKPGEERTGVNLQMQFQPTSRIEGTIVDSRGLPISVQLTVTRRSAVQALNTSQVRPAQTDSRFTIPSLGPGLYSVSAKSRDASSGAVMWASADVSLSGGDPTVVTLSLLPAATVAGRVVFEGADLAPPADLSRVTVRLLDVGPAARNSTSGALDAAGAITASGVVPGRYMVRAAVPGAVPASGPAWTVRSVMTGGRDVTDVGFDITDGGLADLTVTFTSQVSELSGALTTQSGAPETDYFVIAIPANRDHWMPGSRRIVSTRPDAKGHYVFRGLPGGEYRIAVTTDLVPRDLQEMNVIEQLAAQSIPATVVFGQRRVVNIRTPEK